MYKEDELHPMFLQDYVNDAIKPVLPKRKLTAKDLIEEWRRTVLVDCNSKQGGRNDIIKKTKELLNAEILSSYDLDLYRKYDSIKKLVEDDDILWEEPLENRPCHNGHSQLHKLNCGHLVFDDNKMVHCGGNCEVPDRKDPFFCTLCVRQQLDNHEIKVSTRWHDLFLPNFIHEQLELTAFLKSDHQNRMVEPAYLDPHGYILLPRIHCIIAMIKAYEIHKEQEVKAKITALVEPVTRLSPDLATLAIEYFDHFQAFQYELDNPDQCVLAAFAIRLATVHCAIPVDPNIVLKAFNITFRPEYDQLYQTAVNSIFRWGGHLVSYKILNFMPATLRKSNEVKAAVQIARRMWTVYTNSSLYGMGMWRDRTRIMAWCVAEGLKKYRVNKSFEEVFKLTGGTYSPIMDGQWEINMRRFAQDFDWEKDPEVVGQSSIQEGDSGRD